MNVLEQKTWWLSFADGERPQGEQFLGVAIVRAYSFMEAVMRTHQIGINPGGEIQGGEIPYTPNQLDVLLTRDEALAVDDEGMRGLN